MAYCRYSHGLGYDESYDEYKVVCIRGTNYGYQTQMYSSMIDSWKKIESSGSRLQEGYYGKFLNGRMHWLAHLDSNYSPCEIISLDLAREKYQTLSSYNIGNFRSVLLVELGGYLGVTSSNDDWDFNVYVMKEYGVRELWTKIWTLSDFVVDSGERSLGTRPMPLCWRKNGDIVVIFGQHVFVCNGKNILRKVSCCYASR